MAKSCSYDKDVTSTIKLHEESKLTLTSITTPDKCRVAKSILKKEYYKDKQSSFLDLIDINLLASSSNAVITNMLAYPVFTEGEQAFILEARRKYKNRIAAKKIRDDINKEIYSLGIDIDKLNSAKCKMEREKYNLQMEIQKYRLQIESLYY